jgi:hypothetical protein
MKHIVEQPLEDFMSVLSKTRSLLAFISDVKDFSGTALIIPDKSYQDIIDNIQLIIKQSSINMLILSGTLLLYTVGQFENYIKETMKIVGEDYASKIPSFDYLPSSMQTHLVYQTAEIIQKPQKYGHQRADVKSLINQLTSSMCASGSVSINKESLVITEQNMRPDTLSELLKRFDIKDIWKDMAKQTSVKALFTSENEQEIEKQLKEILNNIMEDRNNIAHPSSNPSFPDNDTISKYIAYFEIFANVFTSIMVMKCNVFKPTLNSTF